MRTGSLGVKQLPIARLELLVVPLGERLLWGVAELLLELLQLL